MGWEGPAAVLISCSTFACNSASSEDLVSGGGTLAFPFPFLPLFDELLEECLDRDFFCFEDQKSGCLSEVSESEEEEDDEEECEKSEQIVPNPEFDEVSPWMNLELILSIENKHLSLHRLASQFSPLFCFVCIYIYADR